MPIVNSDTGQEKYCIVLHFFAIMKFIAAVRMLILKKETKHLNLVFYHTPVQITIN